MRAMRPGCWYTWDMERKRSPGRRRANRFPYVELWQVMFNVEGYWGRMVVVSRGHYVYGVPSRLDDDSGRRLYVLAAAFRGQRAGPSRGTGPGRTPPDCSAG